MEDKLKKFKQISTNLRKLKESIKVYEEHAENLGDLIAKSYKEKKSLTDDLISKTKNKKYDDLKEDIESIEKIDDLMGKYIKERKKNLKILKELREKVRKAENVLINIAQDLGFADKILNEIDETLLSKDIEPEIFESLAFLKIVNTGKNNWLVDPNKIKNGIDINIIKKGEEKKDDYVVLSKIRSDEDYIDTWLNYYAEEPELDLEETWEKQYSEEFMTIEDFIVHMKKKGIAGLEYKIIRGTYYDSNPNFVQKLPANTIEKEIDVLDLTTGTGSIEQYTGLVLKNDDSKVYIPRGEWYY